MSKVIDSVCSLQEILKTKSQIGFVPTMGNLHQGHLSLIEKSLQENETTVVSIYVNPTQFGINEDFNNYPRTLERDCSLIDGVNKEKKEIIIFSPKSDKEIYPNGKEVIKAIGPHHCLEGSLRPGHFDGMVTVVKRLFEIVSPHKAYFGKKDYQQYLIVKELVKSFNLNIQIIGMETARERNGLALSSRNGYLTPEELQSALKLRNTLTDLAKVWKSTKNIEKIKQTIKNIVDTDSNFNYLAIADKDSLETDNLSEENLILLGNYQVREVKLIDNLELVE